MKSVITVICLLIPLVIIFVIIDRKDFYSGDDVAIQQETITGGKSTTATTLKLVEMKHAETKPEAETNSAETKSVEETKPVETKPVTESKPVAETKSAEVKSIAVKTIAETKPAKMKPVSGGNLAPFAIPLATKEEAEKLNEEAAKYIKRKNDKTILEGAIKEISLCPDPADIDYPDCNLSANVQINDINQTRVCLIIPCIRNSKKILPDNMQKDALIAFAIKEEESITEKEKSIQMVDDNLDFDLEYLYADHVEPISEYSKKSIYVKRNIEEIKYDTTLVLTDKDKEVRKEYIDREIERLNKIICDYSLSDAKTFSESFSEYSKDISTKHPYVEIICDDGAIKIMPIDFGDFSGKEYLNRTFSRNTDLLVHNAQVIFSIDKYLREMGITLLVVTVPHPYESFINSLHLSKDLSTYNINRILFMKELLSLGVEVLDVEPMIEENLMSNFHFFLSLKGDVHPSEIGAYYISRYICNHLERYDYMQKLIKNDYSIEIKRTKEKVEYFGQSFEDVDSVSIFYNQSPINRQSPFLIVGDSFSYSSHIQNYISYFLKTRINAISRSGSFPITGQMLQSRKNEISKNTKVCILINTTCHLPFKFKELYNEGIQLYPNSALKNTHNLLFDTSYLLKENCTFEINLPDTYRAQDKHIILVYTQSNEKEASYHIKINSQESKTITSSSQNYSCVEFYMPLNSTNLQLNFSASPLEGYFDKDDSYFQVTRIVLVEE